jgi:hypothetical protein
MCRFSSCTLTVVMGSSSTSSDHVSVLQCPVLFNGTNYRGWVPRMCLHMWGLWLWDFLTGDLPYLPPPSAPTQLVIMEKTIATEKEALIVDYDNRLTLYESQYSACRTWLDEDAQAGSILVASMEDWFSAEIVELERSHQMWTFLRIRYEPIRQSTFLAAIHQEQLLCQGDDIIDDLLDQLSVVWHQIDTLGPQLSPATCQSCKD